MPLFAQENCLEQNRFVPDLSPLTNYVSVQQIFPTMIVVQSLVAGYRGIFHSPFQSR
jgi:hypothetical protein